VPLDDERQPDERTAPGSYSPDEPHNPIAPAHPPDVGLTPFDQAVIAAGDMRRRIAANRRAFPPGRSSR
jgi:hypothetical protein